MRIFIGLIIGAVLAVGIPYGLKVIARAQAPDRSDEWTPEPAEWGKVGMRGTESRSTYTVHLSAGTPSRKDFSRPDDSMAIEILQEGPAPAFWITYLATRQVDGKRRALANGSARLERIEQTIETIDGRMYFTTTYAAGDIRLKVLDPSPDLRGQGKPGRYRAILTGRLAGVFDGVESGDANATMELTSFMPNEPWSYELD